MATNNQPINTSGRGPVAGHYRTLTQALAVAMPKCIIWRETGEGTPISVKELYDFARKQDEESPLSPEQFYMVSREGAIGLSPGLEYLTQWIFVPMEPCPLRDFMHKRFNEMSKAIADTYNTYQAQVQQNTNQ